MNIDNSNFDEGTLENGGFLRKYYYLPTAIVYMDGKKFAEIDGATMYNDKKENSQDFLTSLNLHRIDTDGDGRSDITNYQILDNIDLEKECDINAKKYKNTSLSILSRKWFEKSKVPP